MLNLSDRFRQATFVAGYAEVDAEFNVQVGGEPVEMLLGLANSSIRFKTMDGGGVLVVGNKDDFFVIQRKLELGKHIPICHTTSFDKTYGRVRASRVMLTEWDKTQALTGCGDFMSGILFTDYKEDIEDIREHFMMDYTDLVIGKDNRMKAQKYCEDLSTHSL